MLTLGIDISHNEQHLVVKYVWELKTNNSDKIFQIWELATTLLLLTATDKSLSWNWCENIQSQK